MSHARFFLEGEWEEGALPIAAGDVRHLVHVLRAEPGDEVVVVSPAGLSQKARLLEVTADRVSAEALDSIPEVWIPEVHLVQAIAKNPRMDIVVEKATEVGVTVIIPFAAERSVVRLDEKKAVDRAARWQRVAMAASKQSKRATVPRIVLPSGIDAIVESLTDVEHILICDEGTRDLPGVGEALDSRGARSGDAVAVVVGPEGGLTDEELSALEAADGVRVTLGPTILRTETAGAVAVALAAYELGGLGGTKRD